VSEEDGRQSETDQIVDPAVDYKSKRKSILTRQLSTDEISLASEVSELIETLNELCISEVGIIPNDIKPLEIMLKKVAIRDDAASQELMDKMMGTEELVRAKKQLLLQAAVDKVKPNAPLWKLKNLAHQARQIGMENYHGECCHSLLSIF